MARGGPCRTGGALNALAAVLAFLVLAPAALAAPPPNDARSQTQAIGVPESVEGTTVDATVEAQGEPSSCAAPAGTVWYRYVADRDRRVVFDLAAGGDLDAAIDAFRQRRSQLDPLDCEQTDDNGRASVGFDAQQGQAYLIRVTRRTGSEAGPFRLTSAAVQPAAKPPGATLPAAGVRNSVNRTLNPSDAWSVRLSEGVTYRVNLAVSRCANLEIYRPGTRSFSGGRRVETLSCGGYTLLTPGPDEGGRYVLRIASQERGTSSYRLTVAAATGDDTSPGLKLFNYSPARGSLDGGGIDVLDLYRFDVRRRSDLLLDLRTRGTFDLMLLTERGRRLRCVCEDRGDVRLRMRLSRGRYFAAVRAQQQSRAGYRLTRVTRAITATRISVNGASRATIAPGAFATFAASVSGGATGTTLIGVERFDPLEGWQFYARYRLRAVGGRTTVRFRAPAAGRWRARARFLGSRGFSPSRSGYVELNVQEPIGT